MEEKPKILGIVTDVREHTITFTFDGPIRDLTILEIGKLIYENLIGKDKLKEVEP